jgi:hypothetical protein
MQSCFQTHGSLWSRVVMLPNPKPEGEPKADTKKPKRGRPKKFVDLEMIERLASIQCTHTEVASALGISVDTLTRHPNFAEVYKRGTEGGRKSLRRMQFESANKGNVVMQIWLGKQYLGQSDQVKSEIRQLPDLHAASTAQLKELLDDYVRRFPDVAAEFKLIDAQYSVVEPEKWALPAPRQKSSS